MKFVKPGRPTRLIVVGLGSIGLGCLREALQLDEFKVVAGVDPARAGDTIEGLRVCPGLSECVNLKADVALIATGSSVSAVEPVVLEALEQGLNVISSCEELALPWVGDAPRADRIDKQALLGGRSVLACGVNPAYAMDVLPVMLASATLHGTEVRVTRHVDLSSRRAQLSAKLGIGLSPDQWSRRSQEHGLGHQGLLESAHLCAIGLGWQPESHSFVRDSIIRDGVVIGVAEVATLVATGNSTVALTLRFVKDGPSEDRIEIKGVPSVSVVVRGGFQGDQVTVARLLNCARIVGWLSPGLRLPIEVPAWVMPKIHRRAPAVRVT